MTMPLLFVYLVIGALLLIVLAGSDRPTVTAAFRRDLRSLRAHGRLTLVAFGPVWVAGAVVAWPVVAACEAISWREGG
jgi:hypothetical protein